MTTEGARTDAAFVRALPKAELHLHLEGSVAAPTLVDLARRHSIDLGLASIDDLYGFDDLASFLRMYGIVCDAVRDANDFERMTYEALARVAGAGGRYAEMFFSPQAHSYAPYVVMLDGIIAGMRAAEADHGVAARIIPAHNRELGPQAGMAFVEMVVAHRRDEVIGIGLDYLENDPRPFAQMYAYARGNGLHVTAHAGEIGPATFVRDSLDVLGCERIDHGYHVVDDAALERCRADGTFFTCCPTTTLYTTEWRDAAAPGHAIRRMIEAGLTITINTDDPGLMQTTLVEEYTIVGERMGATSGQLKEISLNGIRASWLDAGEKRSYLAAWGEEIDRLLDICSPVLQAGAPDV